MAEYLRLWGGCGLLFVIITAQALFCLSKLHLRFELAVPISLMLDMFILLFAGLICSNLLIGVLLVFLLSVTGLLAVFIKERTQLKVFSSVFRSPGFLVFAVGFVLCVLISMRQIPHAWDDYGHWFPFVKQMVNYDKLYSDPTVYLMKQWYYTPGISLLQYLLCKLVGGFSEGACYTVSTLIMFICALPLLKWFDDKSLQVKLSLFLVVFASMYIAAREDLDGFFLGFRSSYVDVHLSAVSAMLLCWILLEEESNLKIVCVSVISAFLAMMKVTGIMFALLGIGMYILTVLVGIIVCSKNKKKSISECTSIVVDNHWNIGHLLATFLPLFMTVLIYFLWNSQTRAEIEFGSVSGITSGGFLLQLNKYGQGLMQREFPLSWDWIRTYFYSFFKCAINDGALVEVSSSVFVIVFWIILFATVRRSPPNRPLLIKLVVFGACLTAGLFVYLLAIGISFYSFEENLSTMTSFKRYLSSYMGIFVIMSFLLGTCLLFTALKSGRKQQGIALLTALVALIVLLPTDFFPVILGQAESKEYRDYYNCMSMWGENLNRQLSGESSSEQQKVFLVKTGHGGPDTPSLAADVAMPGYFILPLELQNFSQYRYDPDSALPFYTREEWMEVLLDYNFSEVLLANYSIPALNWSRPDVGRIPEMERLFDVPPEELYYDAPMLFKIDVDDEGQVHLRHVLVESPIK